jgi:cysteine desulfurase
VSAPIYLDYQATTPLAPEAYAAMRPWLGEGYGNPHSPHRLGREAKAAVEIARDAVVAALGLAGGELVFTGGATEAINLALKGVAFAAPAGRRKIVTIATEHAAVLDSVAWLARQGFEAVVLPVDERGLVDLDGAAAAIDDRTAIVAAMLVNNEIGVIQPVAELAALARAVGALLLCDAVQGFGRIDVPGADLVALSAHKIHGPKGVGALWVKAGTAIEPVMHGGGQEGGLRSGTVSPALCAGFGAAVRLAAERREADAAHVERLWSMARERLAGWVLNGDSQRRYHGNINVRREGSMEASRLISEVRGVAFSAGSACASGSGRPSHVLKAIGLSEPQARASIRLGFGRYTSEGELGEALDLIEAAAERQGLAAA